MNLPQFMQPNFSFSCTLFIIFIFLHLLHENFFIPCYSILREIFHLTQKHTKKGIFIITAFPSHLSFLKNEIKFINRTCNHKKVFIFLTHSFSLARVVNDKIFRKAHLYSLCEQLKFIIFYSLRVMRFAINEMFAN